MRVPGDPVFPRMVLRAMAACAAALAVAALLLPAPLQEAADLGSPPNPARSAWFLLWVQELVSHGTIWIYPATMALAVLAALPWIPGKGIRISPDDGTPEAERAPRAGGAIAVAMFAVVVALTLVAAFCRGRNWAWAWPF